MSFKRRLKLRGLIVIAIGWLVADIPVARSAEFTTTLSPQGSQTLDAAAPKPTAQVKSLLDRIDAQITGKQYQAALAAAIRAADSAKRAKDLVGEALVIREEAVALDRLERFDDEIEAWTRDELLWQQIPYGPGQVEALTNSAILLAGKGQPKANTLIARAIRLAREERRHPLQAARELNMAARRAYGKGRPDLADSLVKVALPLAKSVAPNSVDYAACLNTAGDVADDQGSLSGAEARYSEALKIEKLLPESAEEASSLSGLGNVAEDHSSLDSAKTYYQQALDVAQRVGPKSKVARFEINLGDVARTLNDWSTARAMYERAKLADPEDPQTKAVIENNEGMIDLSIGDLVRARTEFEAAQHIWVGLNPNSVDLMKPYNNLALVDFDYGDLKTAKDYYEKAIAIMLALNPNSPALAAPYFNLASLLMDRGDLASSEAYYRQTMTIDKKLDPKSGYVAADLASLGHVKEEEAKAAEGEEKSKDLSDARKNLEDGMAIVDANASLAPLRPLFLGYLSAVDEQEGKLSAADSEIKEAVKTQGRIAPDSTEEASYLGNAGDLALLQNNLTDADSDYTQALHIVEKYPNSINTARLLSEIAVLRMKQASFGKAIELLSQALGIIDQQRSVILGADSRAMLASANDQIVELLVGAYVKMHKDVEAYNTMERVRGRSLTESIFEHRHIDFKRDVPQELLDRQVQLDNNRSIAAAARQGLDPKSVEYKENGNTLEEINRKQRELEDEIRRASPHFANLEYPLALDLDAVQKALDPGTLLLEYSVGIEGSYIFAVTKNSMQSYPIDSEYADLLKVVTELFDSVKTDRAASDQSASTTLYNLLISPAAKEVSQARRLLICPEKFLWKVPFCALIDNGKTGDQAHYLIESKPIHTTVSMNVYAELVSNRNRNYATGHSMVAFGNPKYSSTTAVQPKNSSGSVSTDVRKGRSNVSGPSPQSDGGTTLGRRFSDVTITGYQVEAIRALFGASAEAFEQKDANRSKVLAEAPKGRYIHFACHGWMDDGRDPFSSFLALTPSAKSQDEFGPLAAFDVIQNLKVNADLVTMAACQTGAGQVTDTEGIAGLSRAFLYAGAQSVLSTGWEIDAFSSSRLMSGTDPVKPSRKPSRAAISTSFYGALLAGKTKDVALQTAQVAMIHGPNKDYRDPGHWAAFVLQGDWK